MLSIEEIERFYRGFNMCDDAKQEALIKCMGTRIDTLGHARTVLINQRRDMWRKQARTELRDHLYYRQSEQLTEQSHNEVTVLLEQLSEPFRSVIELYYLHGLDYKEIAEKLSIPLNTVCTRMKRAKEKLREIYLG